MRDTTEAVVDRLATGTALRDGVDRILRGGCGGLLVLGDSPAVRRLCQGGFALDTPFSPGRLRELSKMDGAVLMSADASRIVMANVHLGPDPTIESSETGTRHRTAEQVSRQAGVPTIAVSQSLGTVTVYAHGARTVLGDPVRLRDLWTRYRRAVHALVDPGAPVAEELDAIAEQIDAVLGKARNGSA